MTDYRKPLSERSRFDLIMGCGQSARIKAGHWRQQMVAEALREKYHISKVHTEFKVQGSGGRRSKKIDIVVVRPDKVMSIECQAAGDNGTYDNTRSLMGYVTAAERAALHWDRPHEAIILKPDPPFQLDGLGIVKDARKVGIKVYSAPEWLEKPDLFAGEEAFIHEQFISNLRKHGAGDDDVKAAKEFFLI